MLSADIPFVNVFVGVAHIAVCRGGDILRIDEGTHSEAYRSKWHVLKE